MNKEHIGDGLTLADDPEFAKKPDSATALLVPRGGDSEDPGCEEAAGWAEYRLELMALASIDWQDAAALAFDWMNARDMMKTKIMDEEAKHCLPGVITSIYMLARWSLEVDGSWESAVYLARTLSGYASSMHPEKFDQITSSGQRWPITVGDLDAMRWTLARQSANRTTSSWKNRAGESYVGNAFGLMGTDEIEPGIALRESMKVYVYDVEEYPELTVLARGAAFCRENQWGFEVSLHEFFLACPCRTDDPAKADFFFVPHYTACHLNVESFTEEESERLFISLLQKLPHFQRSQGRDHVFTWGGGFGVDGPFRSWRRYIEDSIFLMTETELWNPYHDITTPSFTPWKDILIPGRISLSEVRWSLSVRDAPRPYLADFVGWNRPLHSAQGGLAASSPRDELLRMANEPDLHIRQDVPYMEAARGALSSKFCFVPRGKSAWSSRYFRVLFADCLPVLLNDFYEPPYGEIFDSSGFVVRWPMQHVGPKLLEVLRAIPQKAYEGMKEKARSNRCWYVWIPSVMDHDHVDIQKGKLDEVCPSWKSQNAFLALMRLLRGRLRASHWPSLGKAFHVPNEAGEAEAIGPEVWAT